MNTSIASTDTSRINRQASPAGLPASFTAMRTSVAAVVAVLAVVAFLGFLVSPSIVDPSTRPTDDAMQPAPYLAP